MNCLKIILLFTIFWFCQIADVKAQVMGAENSLAIAHAPNIHYLLQAGLADLELGNLEKARHSFDRIIDLYPNLYEERNLSQRSLNADIKSVQLAYLNRGLAAYRLGQYQTALTDWAIAQNLSPWQFEAHYNLGLAWSSQKEYTKAIAAYNRALTQVSSQNPEQIANIYNDRGLAYLNLHNFAAAINDFSVAIRQQKNNSWLHYNLGCACHQQGNYLQAIKSFSDALAANPEQAEAYINRGLIYYHLGRVQLALSDLNAGADSFHRQGQTNKFTTAMTLIEQMQRQIPEIPSFTA